MKDFRTTRELAGLSQVALARHAGVSRARLQQAEAGELTLRSDEIEAIERALRVAIEDKTTTLQNALAQSTV